LQPFFFASPLKPNASGKSDLKSLKYLHASETFAVKKIRHIKL